MFGVAYSLANEILISLSETKAIIDKKKLLLQIQ